MAPATLLLSLDDTKAPNYRNNNWLKDLGNYFEWPKVAGAMIKTVFTILPHFVLRYRTMRPDVARDALVATHGGLSLAWCATLCYIAPMALSRVICAFGQ